MIDDKLLVGAIIGYLVIPVYSIPVLAQENVIVNQTNPCFLNYSAGVNMWENCNADTDWLKMAIAPFEWITGGFFSFLFVGIISVVTYQKYHKVVYPIMIGIFMLPISYFLIPSQFYIWAILMVGVTFGILMWYVFIRQTKEWS